MSCQEKRSRVDVTEVIVSNTQVDHVGKVTSQAVISFKHHCIKYDMGIVGAWVPQPLREKEVEPRSVSNFPGHPILFVLPELELALRRLLALRNIADT